MIQQKPTVMLIPTEEPMEGDCACPGLGVLPLKQTNFQAQDCACPDAGLVGPSHLSLPAGPWRYPADLYRAPLPGAHEIVFAPRPGARIAVLSPTARRILDAFALPRGLPQAMDTLPDLEPGDVVHTARALADQGLIQNVAGAVSPCQALPHTLTVWLHVTRRCNLQCAYCYAEKGEEEMSDATGQAVLQAVVKSAARHGFRALKLKYAGGEPTLNFGLVQALHDRAEALAARGGLALHEVVLSNGVGLGTTLLTAIRDMGMQLAISLDGIGAAHEAQRGANTYLPTTQAIEEALRLGLKPHISVTVTSHNARALRQVVAYALERGLTPNLNFYRECGEACQAMDWRAGDRVLIEGVRTALAEIEARLPEQSIAAGLLDRANLAVPHFHTCGAGQSYLAIDPQGRVSRCHMDMSTTLGHAWEGDPLAAIQEPTGGWRNLEVDGRRECSSCIWRYYCTGGCPLLTYRLTGQDDGASPYCEVYRTLLPEVLRVEALRLLRLKGRYD